MNTGPKYHVRPKDRPCEMGFVGPRLSPTMPAPADRERRPEAQRRRRADPDRQMKSRTRMIPCPPEMRKKHYAAALFRGRSPFADRNGVHWPRAPDDHQPLEAIRKVLGREVVAAAVDPLRKNWPP